MVKKFFVVSLGTLLGLVTLGALAVWQGATSTATLMQKEVDLGNAQIANELQAQRITFPEAKNLKDEERAQPCVVANAGQLVQTGAQAKCFRDSYLGLHVNTTSKGETYASMGDVQKGLKAQIAQAQSAGDQDAVVNLNRELTSVNSARETVFKGETLKGLLGIPYAFSQLIARGEHYANTANQVAGNALRVAQFSFAALVVFVGAVVVVNRRRQQQQLDHELEELENEVRVAA